MEETSTPELRKHSFDKKFMYHKKNALADITIETSLKNLLDSQLENPRKQIVDKILDISKKNL